MGVYLPDIPQATDLISVSQGQLLTNFQTLNTGFGIDHYEFNNATTDRGKHKHASFVDQTASIPVPPMSFAIANELVVFGVTTGGITSLYYQKDATATVFTLNPIRAFALFQTQAGAPFITAVDSFNISTVTRPNVTSGVVTVTLLEPMKSINNYAIFFTSHDTTAAVTLTSKTYISTTSFSLTIAGISVGTGQRFDIMLVEV